jgi:hypothetical protein
VGVTLPTAAKRIDLGIAGIFALLTVAFVILAASSDTFFEGIWARHHNVLSWYIRPLFLVPFCFFAFRRSWAGVAGTIFALTTSMAWFPPPEVAGEQAVKFLAMEKRYMHGTWDAAKVLMSLLVPVTFVALGAAFWRRNLWFGIFVLVAMATSKLIWSVAFGGQSGRAIFAPALVGLVVCIAAVWAGFRRLHRKSDT